MFCCSRTSDIRSRRRRITAGASLSVYESGLKSVRQARAHLDAFAKRLEAMRELEEEAFDDADDDEE